MAASTGSYLQRTQNETQNLLLDGNFLTFEDDVVLSRCPEMISYSKMFKDRFQNRTLFLADGFQVKFQTRTALIRKTKWRPPKPVTTYKMKRRTVLKHSNCGFLPVLPPVEKYLKEKCKPTKGETGPLEKQSPSKEKITMDQGNIPTQVEGEGSDDGVNDVGQKNIGVGQMKTWNKKDASLLSELFQKIDFLAYKMPNQKGTQPIPGEPEEKVNQSALSIDVKSTEFLPAKTLKDVLNPKVGKTVLHPSNAFQMELLTGVPLIHDPSKAGLIVTGTDTEYKKYKQEEYPPVPDEWYPTLSEEQGTFESENSPVKKEAPKIRKLDKGFVRWTALPEMVMDTKTAVMGDFHRIDDEAPSSPNKMTSAAEKSSLEKIFELWQVRWQLTSRLNHSSVEDIFLDMTDLHPNVRCSAVVMATKIGIQCKCSSSNRNESLKLIARKNNKNELPNLLDTIISAVQCMLGDPHENVKMAAALAMFCLEEKNEKAESVIRDCLISDNLLKRWVAAQCLGHAGYCDSDVISEIIQQIFASTDMDQVAQGTHLLIKLSRQSSLIQSLVAEHLNSSRWQSKVMACQIFPQLHSEISKDISNKIKCLMWSDWHPEVRLQAAHCLGKTKQGKKVHDDLLMKLKHLDPQIRIKAIRLIGYLGLMTRKLALLFLQCFKDPHLSVRCETCITCGKLRITDPDVLEKLVDIATHDPLWKLKALAIQALGQIGVLSEEIKNCLLWSVHYSNHFAIRAEACRSLRFLKEKSSEVVATLQERFLAENDAIVKNELQKYLMEINGWSPKDEIDEVQKVKQAVRMLSTPHSVTQRVILMDHWLQSEQQGDLFNYPSQFLPEMDSSRMKTDVPVGYTLPKSSELKFAEENFQEMAVYLTSSEKTNVGEAEENKRNEPEQSKKNNYDRTDLTNYNLLIERCKSDSQEKKAFLTEIQPQMLSQNYNEKTEIKPDIKTENKSRSYNEEGKRRCIIIPDSRKYKDLVNPLVKLVRDSPKKTDRVQGKISFHKLEKENFLKEDKFSGCFDKLL